jgi:hypothetical protein
MRTQLIAAVAAALFNLVAAPSRAAETLPQPVSQRFSGTEAGGDRAAPSTYQYDNGIPTNTWTLGANETCWAHRFSAVGGADAITSVSAAFGVLTNGTPARVFIWQDPTNDGNPADKVLLATANITVQNANTGILNVYTLPAPVPVTGDFYVGVSVVVLEGQFPIPTATPDALVPGRAFYAARVPPIDPATVDLGAWSPNFGTFLLRANGSNAGFTYQGRLTNTGTPYTGNGDIAATIYDAATGGNVVANTFAVLNVTFTQGLFNVRIPAAASTFDPGADRWLEIAVRTPAGAGSYNVLSPRQRITSAPTAISAITATSAASVPWSGITGVPANISLSPWAAAVGGITYSGGAVGIGKFPDVTLDIVQGGVIGNSTVVGSQHDPANSGIKVGFGYQIPGTPEFAGMRAYVNSGSNGCGNSADLLFDTWECNTANSRTVMRITGGGRVGIGTFFPDARTEIDGRTGDGLLISTDNGSPWALRIRNYTALDRGFETGMYVTNDGFFRISNRISNPSGSYAQLASNGAWSALSDARLKTDVTNAEGNLDAALKLRPVNFRWKANGAEDFGLIAQEVREVLPKLVTGDESKDSLTLNYSQLSVVAIGAIQELKADNDRKQREIDDLKSRLAAIEASLRELQSK